MISLIKAVYLGSELHRSQSSETSNSGFEICGTEHEAVGGQNALGAQDFAACMIVSTIALSQGRTER
jgi:hypothetical protein